MRLWDARLTLIAPLVVLVFVPGAFSQTPLSVLPDNPLIEEAIDYGMLGNLSFVSLMLPEGPTEAAAGVETQAIDDGPVSALQLNDLARVLEHLSDQAGIGGPGSEVQLFEVPDTLLAPDDLFLQHGISPPGPVSFGSGSGGLFQLPQSLGGTTGGAMFHLPAGLYQGLQASADICPTPQPPIIVVKELPDQFKVGNRTVAVFNSREDALNIGVEIDGTMQPFLFAPGEFMAFVVADGAAAFGEVHTNTKGLDRMPLQRGSIYSVVRSTDGKFVFSEIRHGNQ